MANRYLEDFTVGEVIDTVPVTLSPADIIGFGRLYDPQSLHIDPEAAQASEFGGLIASGFQTLAVAFGQFVRLGHLADSSLGGPAMDEVRWTAPVRPDEPLNTRAEVIETRRSRSKPDRGILRLAFTISRDDGTVLATFKSVSLLRRRPG